MEREVHYCTTEDGVRIAYTLQGEGPSLLICSIMWESFTVDHLVPDAARFYDALGEGRRVIRYDPRNVGLSQRGIVDVSVEALVKDMAAVVEAAVGGPISIYGSTASVARAVLYAVRHPERVQQLALHNGYARVADTASEGTLQALVEMTRSDWPIAAKAFAGETFDAGHDYVWAQAYVESMTGDDVSRALAANLTTDVTPFLADVSAPTLVTHYANNSTIPLELGQQLAAGISHASLITIRPTNVEEWLHEMVSAIDSFLPKDPKARRPNAAEPATAFRTILFTDLVGHAEMMSRLGDAAGRQVLREHESLTREVLKSHGGSEVKTMGDGFMASLGSVTKAVECAIALQRAFDKREGEPLSVRVGLNAGEPIEEDGDLFGATVILASRIAAKAEGGEILVADTVRGLCSGKGFLFSDRGEFAAKGFEEPVRVYVVSWRD